MVLNDMLMYITNYFKKVEKGLMGATPLVFEEITLAENAIKVYDLTTFFEPHELYHLHSAKVIVAVRDTDPNSSTFGFFVNPEAIVNSGIDETGKIVVENFGTTPHQILIRIESPVIMKV